MANQETGLSTRESALLAEMVDVVDRQVNGFLAVGNALMVIKNKELYRETHDSFEAFCKDRWGIGKAYSYRLIESSKVMDRLASQKSPTGDKQSDSSSAIILPTAETQTRELAKVEDHEQAEVWAKVLEVTDKPTAKIVKSVVKQWNKLKEKLSPKPKEDKKTEAEIIEEPEAASEPIPDTVSDSAESRPNGGKVYKHDAPMPEFYIDDNNVDVPLDLYPAWRAKNRYSMLCDEPRSFDTCRLLKELGEELGHQATIDMAKELRDDIAEFGMMFRQKISSVQPSVVIDGEWKSRSEVGNG